MMIAAGLLLGLRLGEAVAAAMCGNLIVLQILRFALRTDTHRDARMRVGQSVVGAFAVSAVIGLGSALSVSGTYALYVLVATSAIIAGYAVARTRS